ncbi:hypothetical protein I6A60_30930 [Frankia sp. AgB1.9]|uniref:hypothetical protein n=1 Tax=unclassified Frankia TaxID=2632575 RepID=UPI00193161C4|nr:MULTISPECIES: hypothetical protein [unclassified Frankia]MBL7490799.1 hypothetical protein [Frankia sp. AgW1.1]MBL7552244.1 hypothetical protein [Frankia sp. AgB1.9]MBL7621997.1 hypothetical protein [Frankia sp. AgB1.8]
MRWGDAGAALSSSILAAMTGMVRGKVRRGGGRGGERWAERLIAHRQEERRWETEAIRRREAAIATATARFREDVRRQVLQGRIAEVAFTDDARAYADALDATADDLQAA